MEKYIQLIREKFQKLTAAEQRRLAVICTAAFAFLLTLSVIISVINSGSEKNPLPESERNRFILAIPAEELFLPDEPSFLPGVLLEREKRASWNEQDASEHWQDPLKAGEEPWRRKVETFIDNILERIP